MSRYMETLSGYKLHPRAQLIFALVIITATILHGIDMWILSIPKPIIDVIRMFGLMAVSLIASQHAAIWEKTSLGKNNELENSLRDSIH